MAGEVLRMKLFDKFELWCFVSTVVLCNRHYAKPQTVSGNQYQNLRNINNTTNYNIIFYKLNLTLIATTRNRKNYKRTFKIINKII